MWERIVRGFGIDVYTILFKMDSQQGPTIQHREVCSVFCGSLGGRGGWGRVAMCVCMTGSL